MIKKLRWKFVAALMVIVTVFTLALLIILYASSASNYEQASQEALHAALDRGASANNSLPMTVVHVSPSGKITILVNRIFYLDDEKIAEMVRIIQASETKTGMGGEYSLRWLSRDDGPAGVLYAFADTYPERNSLRSLAFTSIIIGIGSFLVFFIVSVFLSRWMVRPVEEAWNKQRQFVADASHELKTPLTAVLSNVDMVIDTPGAPPEKNRRRLEIAKTELVRMKGLVEKLLTLARADAAEAQMEAIPAASVDFSDIVTCSAASFEPVIYDSGKRLSSTIAEGLYAKGDGKKLREIADILLDNACKYSSPGSVIELKLSLYEKKRLRLSVSTQGDPISEANRERIFERFYRVDESRGEIKGYGLGLSIARSIVEETKGRIWAESGDTEGNAFIVELPIAEKTSA